MNSKINCQQLKECIKEICRVFGLIKPYVLPVFFWLLLTAIYCAYHYVISSCIFKCELLNSILTNIASGIDKHWYMNVCVTITFVILFRYIYSRIKDEYNYFVDSIGIVVFFTFFYFNHDEWCFVSCWPFSCICFDHLLLLLPISLFLVLLAQKLLLPKNKAWKDNNNSNNAGIYSDNKSIEYKGFTTDTVEVTKRNGLRHTYAKSVVEQLLQTCVSDEAFAVSINGKWGSGKTTFIKDMQFELQENAELLTFNPWEYNSESQLIEGFFNEMAHQFKGLREKSLSVALLNYARLLLKETPTVKGTPLSVVFDREIPGFISEQKCTVEEKIKKLNKKLFVFIDDLDRMKSDEVFEVMRLIRNTANLPNVIFVVTMDTDYIVEMLDKTVGEGKGSLYIEKIFQLEIELPKIESVELHACMINELNEMLNTEINDEDFMSIFDKIQLEDIFHSYRKIKHFARSFAVLANHIINKEYSSNVNLYDLFLLELLKAKDASVYFTLMNNRSCYLEHSIIQGIPIYVLKQDNDITFQNTDNTSKKILHLLFDWQELSYDNINRLLFLENFETYFCVGIPGDLLSPEDFRAALHDPIESVYSWCTSSKKQPNSIFNQFIMFSKLHINDVNLRNFVEFACDWLRIDYRNTDVSSQLLKHLLSNDLYKIIGLDDSRNLWLDRLRFYIKNERQDKILDVFARSIANAVNSIIPVYDINNEESNLLLNYKQLAYLLFSVFEQFAECTEVKTPFDYIDQTKGLSTLAANSSFYSEGGWYSPNIYHIINWFKEKKITDNNHSADDVKNYMKKICHADSYKQSDIYKKLFRSLVGIPDEYRPYFSTTSDDPFDYFLELFK